MCQKAIIYLFNNFLNIFRNLKASSQFGGHEKTRPKSQKIRIKKVQNG